MSVSKSSSSTKTSDCANSAIDDLETLNSPCLNLSDMPSLKSLSSLQQNSKKMKENEKTCCVCSEPLLLQACSYPECKNEYHGFCISSYFPELDSKSVCPSHSCKQLETLKKRLHLANHFNSSKSIQKIVKDEKESKVQPDLKGKLFWFGINQQYFPYFTGNKPEFFQTELKNQQQIDFTCWIQQKIEKTCQKLSAVSNLNESLMNFRQIHNNFSTFLEKPGLHLLETGNLQHDLQENFRKNSEILLRVPEKTELKDYHSSQADDKIICAVCDDGESTLDNLIVICSRCNLAVHCGCYNIQEIPEHDWHCDVCSAAANGTNCVLCPVPGGALKLAKPNKWVHVTCARYLLTTNLFSFSWDTRNIDRDKLRLSCYSCGKQYGACVQCNYGRCSVSFHVECRKDLIEYEQDSVYWLCPQHKIKKLWRKVKTERELGSKYIDKVSEALWKERNQETKPNGKTCQKQAPSRKVVMHITPELISMKIMIGAKIIQECKYISEYGNEARKRKRNEEVQVEICQTQNEPKELEEIQETEKGKGKLVEGKGKTEKVKLKNEEEKEKEPFFIFKSSKVKQKNEDLEVKKEKRKYKPRKLKNPEKDLQAIENNGKYEGNTELNNPNANITIIHNLNQSKSDNEQLDDVNIEQFFYQEPEAAEKFSEKKEVDQGVKKIRKRKENKEKTKKPRPEKKTEDKKQKIPKERVKKPRKPKRVIIANPSSKGELWVKLLVPLEIYDRVCKKKRKV